MGIFAPWYYDTYCTRCGGRRCNELEPRKSPPASQGTEISFAESVLRYSVKMEAHFAERFSIRGGGDRRKRVSDAPEALCEALQQPDRTHRQKVQSVKRSWDVKKKRQAFTKRKCTRTVKMEGGPICATHLGGGGGGGAIVLGVYGIVRRVFFPHMRFISLW